MSVLMFCFLFVCLLLVFIVCFFLGGGGGGRGGGYVMAPKWEVKCPSFHITETQ